MIAKDNADPTSSLLARRAIIVTGMLAFVGAAVGLLGALRGIVTGPELPLVLSCACFATGVLVTQFIYRRVPLQSVATVATVYFAVYLCAGAIMAITAPSVERLDLFIYMIWFFPLLVFNKLVNAPAIGRTLARFLVGAPLAIVVLMFPRLVHIFPQTLLFALVTFCLSYISLALMFDTVTRYREEFVAERERAESLKVEAAVLESISDCFISFDTAGRLVYLNDAACSEFSVERQHALRETPPALAPAFFSAPMLAGLESAAGNSHASVFESHNCRGDRWYELRCFPRPDGLSIYFRNITSRRAADAKIQHLAFYDALTELPNRVLLRQRLESALAGAERQHRMGALLFIDLDDFKTLNDTLGHDIGDRFLKEIGVRLASCVRLDDTVARLGGDEFVVMLEGLGNAAKAASDGAQAVAAKILEALSRPFPIGSVHHTTTASIGIALFSGRPDTVDELLKRADLAMYEAKARGRNGICFFDPVMQVFVASRAELQADLRAALIENQFELHYQPQVDRDARIIGAEALIRWRHPRRGLVGPGDFIALAEEAGLIIELGRWVMQTACRRIALWSTCERTAQLTLAVNVSLRQFLDTDFVALVLDALQATGADPRKLKLEITESSAMENVDDTIAKMTALKAHGVGFAIDDFGTGYSSLSHLKRLPLDQLKIDRSFVDDVLADDRDASIVRTLIALGRNLNLAVIAEGVETTGQRDFLEREGCHLYQGFLISPALAAEPFDAFVAAAANAAARSHAVTAGGAQGKP